MKIDDYYKAIGKRIDRNISELTAVKNYQLTLDKLTVLEKNHEVLQSNYNLVRENIGKLKQANEWLEKRLENQFRELTRQIMQKDQEIKKLKQALDFRRAADSSSEFDEPRKDLNLGNQVVSHSFMPVFF